MAPNRLLVLFLANAGLLLAEDNYYWMDGKLVIVKPADCTCLARSYGAGVGLGSWFAPQWGVAVDFLDFKLDARQGLDARERQGMASVLFNPVPGPGIWRPYLKLGAGAARVGAPLSLGPGSTTRLALGGGAGVQALLGAQGLASLEVRAVNIATRERRTELQGLLGLGFRWGGAKAAPPGPEPSPEPPAPEAPPPPPPPPPAPIRPLPPVIPPVPPPAPPRPSLELHTVHFANNRWELDAEGLAAVRKLAGELARLPGRYVLMVTGHTSSPGTAAWNRVLSQRRAEAVVQALVAEGVPPERIRTRFAGPDEPLESNDHPKGQARNRRTEIGLVEAPDVDVRHGETGLVEAPRGARSRSRGNDGRTPSPDDNADEIKKGETQELNSDPVVFRWRYKLEEEPLS